MKKMKPTGIIHHVDFRGRVVIPIEIREKFNIGKDDPVEVFVTEDSVTFQKKQALTAPERGKAC